MGVTTAWHLVDNRAGWRLSLKQVWDEERRDPSLRPVAIIPGYGMNAYIFGYHPRGRSMEQHLAERGFEVWSVNLRGQGGSIRDAGGTEYGFSDVVLRDLPAAVDAIVEKSLGRHRQIDLVGCSLGGTYVYAYAALVGTGQVGSLVGMGAPLAWVAIHPVLSFAFRSPRLAGALKFSRTRELARIALPLLIRCAPRLLEIYLHPAIVDLSRLDRLVQTVEDPVSRLNREIVLWIRNRDLVIDGQNVTAGLSKVSVPLLCLLSNADGIVPEATALSVRTAVSSQVKDVLVAGTDTVRMAHADMYISDYAEEQVFQPLSDWLLSQNRTAGARGRRGVRKTPRKDR